MKETMDGVAKRAHELAQNTLPERPHHLSRFLTERFPSPDGFWFTRASGPLQYMTYLSDAHRGVLATRPSYDICDDLDPAPLPLPARVLTKADGVKKKLSIKDYQNRIKSASPTDNDAATKMEPKTNGRSDIKSARESARKDGPKPRDSVSDVRNELRPEKPRHEQNGDRYVFACLLACATHCPFANTVFSVKSEEPAATNQFPDWASVRQPEAKRRPR
jgi:hypothetical protein